MSYRRRKVIANCTLYLGDARAVLPALHDIDCIITDPVWPNCPPGLIPGSENPDELFAEFCTRLPVSLRQLVVCLRNDSDPRFLRHVPQRLPFQQLVWCQYALPHYLGRVLGGNECAYVFGRPIRPTPGRRVIPSIAPKAQPRDRPPNGHPCSRALVHQEFLVNWFADPGETVCDPFMGSGTVGHACLNIGRRFIGIEIGEEYFDLACRRLDQAARQGRLFAEEVST